MALCSFRRFHDPPLAGNVRQHRDPRRAISERFIRGEAGWTDHLARLDFFVTSPVLFGRAVLPGRRARRYGSARRQPRTGSSNPTLGCGVPAPVLLGIPGAERGFSGGVGAGR